MCATAHGEAPFSAAPAIAWADAAVPRFISERHYTVKEVAALWNLSQSKVRELFDDEPDVFRDGKPTRRIGSGIRRGYFTTRLPESAILRVHRRLTGSGWYSKLALDQHYTPQQIAKAWALSDTKVRRMFAQERGVLRLGQASRRVGRRVTRRMYTMRVPQTIAQRVYEQRLASRILNGRSAA